tara:strand:+ start:1341 stop:3200 length:1860 start_codon:yes stop_codon:yes gene_type:complete
MSFIEELKRRKVFRVAASYAVVAFIIMQLVEIVFPIFNFPQWTSQFIIIVLLLGFPIAVVISWVFDKTPQGYIKTDAKETEKIGGMSIEVDTRPFYKQKRNIFLVLGVIGGVFLGLLGGNRYISSSIKTNQDLTKMAILPFTNIRQDKENDFLGFALSDEIINQLGYLKSIVVRPSGSVRKYQGIEPDLNDVGNDLDVQLILTGSYLREGDELRLSTELIDLNKNERLWNKTVQVAYDNVFKIQKDISNDIVDGLKYELEPEEINLLESSDDVDPVAYDYYLRAKSNDEIEGLNYVEFAEYRFDLIDKAVKIDPNFGDAWAVRGSRANFLSRSGIESDKYKKIANESHNKAIELSPNSLGTINRSAFYYAETGNVEKATEMILNGMKRTGGTVSGLYGSLGYILRYAGLMDESIKTFQKSNDLNNSELFIGRNMIQEGKSFIYKNQFLESQRIFDDGIKLIKKHANQVVPDILFYQAMPHIYLNQNKKATLYLNTIKNMDKSAWVLISNAYRLLINGDLGKGKKIVEELKRMNIPDSEMKYRFSHFYILLNDKEKALKALDEAVDGGFFCYNYIKSDPLTEKIHNEPKFKQILEKAKIRHELYEKRFGDEIRSLLGIVS